MHHFKVKIEGRQASEKWDKQVMRELLTLQPSHPLLRIFNLSNTRVSVFPEAFEPRILTLGWYNDWGQVQQ